MPKVIIGDRPLSGGRSPHTPPLGLLSFELDSIASSQSTVLGGHVFAGNQPDDFALAGLAADSPDVLLLGLGLGGSIRSILAVNPRARITAVDMSERAVDLCRALHAYYFPDAIFESIVGNAESIETLVGDRKFDAICVDIYDDEGYPDFVLAEPFWGKVVDLRRTDASVVLVNAWGLPTQLDWAENCEAQRTVGDLLWQQTGSVRVLPHRRNVTFVAGDLLNIDPVGAFPLPPVDDLVRRVLPLRATYSDAHFPTERPIPDPSGARTVGKKAAINATMFDLWGEASAKFIAASQVVDPSVRSVVDLTAIDGAAITATFEAGPALEDFLPNVASNWIHQYGVLPEWFFNLSRDHFAEMLRADAVWAGGVWLTQYLSLLLKCPAGLAQHVDLDRWLSLGEDMTVQYENKLNEGA